VDQPAGQVAAVYAIEVDHVDHVSEWLLIAEWRPLPERPVQAMLVEMPDLCDEHVLEVAGAEDQQPVEALAANAADPALRVGSRLRRLHLDPRLPAQVFQLAARASACPPTREGDVHLSRRFPGRYLLTRRTAILPRPAPVD
jgi:hypothetical protein